MEVAAFSVFFFGHDILLLILRLVFFLGLHVAARQLLGPVLFST